MNKRIVNTKSAPAPVGPYNQSVRVGDLLFLSGQIAIEPSSGDLILANIEDETHQVMKNIGAVLEAADMSYRNIVKCSIFVSDMKNYARINKVYATYFDEAFAPARELVEVAALPKGVNIEISVIATIK